MSRAHWLSATLVRAQIPGAHALDLPAGVGIDAAWKATCGALGIAETELARHVASRFRLRLADLDGASATAAKLVPETAARKHNVLALREDDREVVVATADPTDVEAEQAIAFASGRQVVFEVAPPAAIDTAIARTYAPHAVVDALMERVDTARAESVRFVHDDMGGAVAKADSGESAAVVKLTNLILRNAIDQRATALEIGPNDDAATVSLLIDGVWSRLMPLPLPVMHHVIARLRLLGNLGVASRTWARDGIARIRVEGRTYDLLVTIDGSGTARRAHVRIFDQHFAPLPADLSLDSAALRDLRALLNRDGMLVLAGPRESGVASLQYALLRELAAGGRRVGLIDDGLRWELHGVQHVAAAPPDRARAVRACAARAIDVLAVEDTGEAGIVEAAAEAHLPGRLVLVRTEAAGAVDAYERIAARLGVERLAALPLVFVSVRLVRRTCESCAGAGCEHCRRTGLRGVLPLIAILDDADAVTRESAELAVAAAARVAAGQTTPAEIERVLRAAPTPHPPTRPTVVLVADDDPLIRLLARTVLEANMLTAAEAEDGIDALKQIEERPDIDLLVLDLDMPRLDGHDVLARLKRDVRTAGLPVIVLTASTNPADEARALERGAADYIRKPIDPPRFQARVRAVLRRNRG